MNRTVIAITRFAAGAFLAVVVAGCEAEKSRNPLSPNVAGPIAGVSISPPTPVNPVNAEVLNTGPLRLIFNNGSTNGERPLFYIVELASDAGFTNKVFAQSKVNPGSGAQTSIVVDASLTAERTYYWRAKADDGANESDFSAVAKFDLVVPIVIGAPGPVSPVGGVVTSSAAPALVVNNAEVQGRAGKVDYWFEVALDQAFSRTIVGLGVERSGGSTTSAQMPELPGGTTLYWRVVGIGLNGTVTGSWSATQSFRTPAAAPAPPPPGPPPGPNPPPPPAAGCSASGSPANWSTAQWRECFFALVAARGVGPTVTQSGMAALRADLVARGADWQNGWRGDYRPRIFLPVPNCPPPTNPNPPDCTYSRTVDMGDYGGPWQWFPR
jgi:hypothetical protein